MSVEKTILENLIYNEDYARKVFPHLKTKYFQTRAQQIVFDCLADFFIKYDSPPTKDTLNVDLSNKKFPSEDFAKEVFQVVNSLSQEEKNQQWLLKTTEDFCKEKAIYRAFEECVEIISDPKVSSNNQKDVVEKMTEAFAVSFDTHIGHDYFENAEERYAFYHDDRVRIPFGLEIFNQITKGGLVSKSLNVVMAATGGCKSMFLCDLAANVLMQGRNVLYITLEMSEEHIAERIDANLMDTNLNSLVNLPKKMFTDKIDTIRQKTRGKLIIKEYPTTSASVLHVKHLLKELFMKKQYRPDLLIIDYLNLCAPARQLGQTNSYTYVKTIAEEMRGLATNEDLPIMTATQVNRAGFRTSEPEMDDVAESFGLNYTADLMVALISNDALDELNQIQVKQLKNRYNNITVHKKFNIGLDRAKMKFYDVQQDEQRITVSGDTGESVFDKTPAGKNLSGTENWK